MRRERFWALFVQLLIIGSIVCVYYEPIQDPFYRADDYLFLSQATRHGLAKSLIIPWKDHFLPFYRLFMGGLHVGFGGAVPIHAGILMFHVATAALIFRVVNSHTRCLALSALASATYGLSGEVSSAVVWCINGHWIMSLCFVLLMSVCFDTFLKAQDGAEPASFAHYYVGIGCFAVALGIFTNALVAGTIVWAFAYGRLMRRYSWREVRTQIRIVFPFVALVAAYLALRNYFNERYFAYQDTVFQTYSAVGPLTLAEKLSVVKGEAPAFLRRVAQLLLPYFPRHYLAAYSVIAALIAKELAVKRRESHVWFMWLCFALVTLAVPLAARVSLITKIYGSIYYLVSPWYFCYPMAGFSIGLALLLRPPMFLDRKLEAASSWSRMALLGVVLLSLALLNVGNIRRIRTEAAQSRRENLLFSRVVEKYRESMSSFLSSPGYSSSNMYYIKDGPVADPKLYPSGWTVMQHDIFYLYFPGVKNIEFVWPERWISGLYLWTRGGVAPIEAQGTESAAPSASLLDSTR